MGRDKRFSYYRRLSAADQRTYRKSDAVTRVEIGPTARLHALTDALRVALSAGRRPEVERASQSLCSGLTKSLEVPPVRVRVRSVRPADRGGELHGLYTWESGKQPLIEVWMRTARNQNVVAFRTFLRTLIHEVCHHLDFTLFELPETFHTDGFFRRESSLVRQLLGNDPKPKEPSDVATHSEASRDVRRRPPRPSPQLKLFE